MKKISVVIPCYYSENTINKVVSRIVKTINKKNNIYEYEIICINDGSTDKTYDVICNLAKNNPKIKALNLSRNFGQHCALMAGFNYVTGDYILCMDDDGESAPEDMFLLIDKLNEGYDLVSARYKEDNRSIIRHLGTKFSFMIGNWLLSKPRDLDLNSYFVMKRFVMDEIIKYKNPYPQVHGLNLRVTRNIANVELERKKRINGQSNYTLKKLLSLLFNGFTSFSEKPLRLSSYVGIFLIFFDVIKNIASFIIIRSKGKRQKIRLNYPFYTGLILFFEGLLGEYIGRMYISINNAPQYVVKESYNIEQEK